MRNFSSALVVLSLVSVASVAHAQSAPPSVPNLVDPQPATSAYTDATVLRSGRSASVDNSRSAPSFFPFGDQR